MASKPWKRPYKRAKQKLNGLKKLASVVESVNKRQYGQGGYQPQRRSTFQTGVARLNATLERAVVQMDRFQRLPQELRFALRGSASSLATANRGPGGSWGSRQEREKVDSLLNDLDSSINEFLGVAQATGFESDPGFADLRMLRASIVGIHPALGKTVDLKRVEAWVDRMPYTDFSNAGQVRRLANVYVLEHAYDQEWELRYRPAMAGRSLVLLTPLPGFPTVEDLASYDRVFGFKPVYVVAARKPSWRVVWKTSTESWYHP